MKTLQVFSVFLLLLLLLLGVFFPPFLSGYHQVSAVLCTLSIVADQAPDQIGSAGGEVALCFLIRDGETIKSLSARLFLLVLCQSC